MIECQFYILNKLYPRSWQHWIPCLTNYLAGPCPNFWNRVESFVDFRNLRQVRKRRVHIWYSFFDDADSIRKSSHTLNKIIYVWRTKAFNLPIFRLLDRPAANQVSIELNFWVLIYEFHLRINLAMRSFSDPSVGKATVILRLLQ